MDRLDSGGDREGGHGGSVPVGGFSRGGRIGAAGHRTGSPRRRPSDGDRRRRERSVGHPAQTCGTRPSAGRSQKEGSRGCLPGVWRGSSRQGRQAPARRGPRLEIPQRNPAVPEEEGRGPVRRHPGATLPHRRHGSRTSRCLGRKGRQGQGPLAVQGWRQSCPDRHQGNQEGRAFRPGDGRERLRRHAGVPAFARRQACRIVPVFRRGMRRIPAA